MINKQETQNSFPQFNEIGSTFSFNVVKRNHEHIDTDLSDNKYNYYTTHINKPDNLPFSKHQVTNKISTSKYTWYNAVPLILFEQFSKYINLYFLIIAMLQVFIF
jgi:hypothetical protein